MHSLNKGKIGELAVYKDLIEQGYKIYEPLVDCNQVDLVVELENNSMQRVQIKTVNRIDVVAVYFLPKNIIAYVPYDNSHQLCLALSTGKNNQTKGRKWFYSYDRFPEFS